LVGENSDLAKAVEPLRTQLKSLENKVYTLTADLDKFRSLYEMELEKGKRLDLKLKTSNSDGSTGRGFMSSLFNNKKADSFLVESMSQEIENLNDTVRSLQENVLKTRRDNDFKTKRLKNTELTLFSLCKKM